MPRLWPLARPGWIERTSQRAVPASPTTAVARRVRSWAVTCTMTTKARPQPVSRTKTSWNSRSKRGTSRSVRPKNTDAQNTANSDATTLTRARAGLRDEPRWMAPRHDTVVAHDVTPRCCHPGPDRHWHRRSDVELTIIQRTMELVASRAGSRDGSRRRRRPTTASEPDVECWVAGDFEFSCRLVSPAGRHASRQPDRHLAAVPLSLLGNDLSVLAGAVIVGYDPRCDRVAATRPQRRVGEQLRANGTQARETASSSRLRLVRCSALVHWCGVGAVSAAAWCGTCRPTLCGRACRRRSRVGRSTATCCSGRR